LLVADPRVDVNAVDQVGSTPLHFAVQQGAMEIVQILGTRADIKLGMINKRLVTPLDEAIKLKHTHIVTFLEERGAPRNREKPKQ
jgi:ankyrin repeat protein